MRFPLAALGFMIASFILFVFTAVSFKILTATKDAMTPFADKLNNPTLSAIYNNLPLAFGIMAVIFFIAGILAFFFFESVSDEYEYYYR